MKEPELCIGCVFFFPDKKAPESPTAGKKGTCVHPILNPGISKLRTTFGKWTPDVAANHNNDRNILERVRVKFVTCFRKIEIPKR